MYESTFSAGPDDLGGSYSGLRWSYHYARPQGGWTESPAIEAYFKRVADDPSVDPGAVFASWDEAFSREAIRLGIRPDAGSANNIMNYVRLAVGETSWQHIANSGSSITPSGAGALALPFVDTVAAREATAIAGVVAQTDPNNYNGDDAAILTMLHAAGADYTSGLANNLALGTGVYPQGGAARDVQAMGQGSYPVSSPYAALSSFSGFGANGVAYDYAAPAGAPARSGGVPWILILGAAAAAYFLLKKG